MLKSKTALNKLHGDVIGEGVDCVTWIGEL